jgi:hypothetical protein
MPMRRHRRRCPTRLAARFRTTAALGSVFAAALVARPVRMRLLAARTFTPGL